ncbi:MAG: type VI secretion system tip protein TssI/VgrG [Bryobacteraceae bacterium]
MPSYVQANRRIAISTPLGKDVLLLRGFTGGEAISQMFSFDLDLVSENDSLKFQDVVGQNVTLRIFDADGEERSWNGFISRFSQGSQDRRLTAYRAQMVPWLWFLTRTADCRIFQNQKVPDIIQKIFKDLNFHDFELRLYGDFTPRDYCVQYRETDFNFVSRLMEEEGIYYYFRHEAGKHVLVLANDPAAHEPCPKQTEARYDLHGGGSSYEDVITEWRYEEEFRPGAWSQTDYNFETPSTSLAVSVKGKNPYEIYDYPGEHRVRSEGDRLARIRLQEQTAALAVSHGSSVCRHFSTGFKFTLKDHYRSDLNQAYLLTSVQHIATQGDYGSGSGDDEELTYQNRFQCIPFSVPFRPSRVTPQPFVQGCQTAVVVGPAGEEIYTDKHGRVKVQFHWDREGKRNESSSCWIRVSHPWAGKGWGSVSIPRIGQEVIVDFLEGDPDQPIIVGRVYNAEQGVPFGMPAGAMVSGIKSNSTKGGGGYNEISLNDTKGTELINIHAQYDQQKKVEHDERVNVGNDRTESVGHDEKITIGNNRTEKVGVNENITIGSNRTESVGANENISIGSNRTETVGGNETISIGSNRTETVGSNESITVALTRTRNVGVNEMVNVGAAQEITVGGLQAVTVGLTRAVSVGVSQSVSIGTSLTESVGTNRTENIGANQSVTVGSNLSENVGSDHSVTIGSNLTESIGSDHKNSVGGSRTTNVSSDDKLEVGSNLTISAASQITLETGSSKIVMKSGGQIEISGMSIEIKGSTSVKAEAVTINVEASGIHTIKGSLVKIN